MTYNYDPNETQTSFVARAAKAFTAGVSGAVTTGGAALTAILSDGVFDGPEVWPLLGAVAAGFVVAFAATYRVPNAQ